MQRFFCLGTNQIVPYSTCIRVEADRDFSNYRNMTSFRFLDFNGKNLTIFVQCIEMCNSKLLVNREIGLEITKLAPDDLETFSISIMHNNYGRSVILCFIIVLCRFELLRGGFWNSWLWIAARLNSLFGSHFLFLVCSVHPIKFDPYSRITSLTKKKRQKDETEW